MSKLLKRAFISLGILGFCVCSAFAVTNLRPCRAEEAEPNYYVDPKGVFALLDGASVRLDNPTGIRFATTVADEYASGKEFGTIVVPKHLNDDNTVDIDDAAQGLNIPFVNVFATTNGAKVYTAVVGDMPINNTAALNLQFQAASYAKEGDSYTYTQTVTRSIAQVASMAYRENSNDTASLGLVDTAIANRDLSIAETNICVGKTKKLAIQNLPEGIVGIWTSEAEEVATVAEDGTVTAKAKGPVEITVKVGSTTVVATVNVQEHDLTKTSKESTWTESGWKYEKCSNCDYTKYEVVSYQTRCTLDKATDFADLYASADMSDGCSIVGNSSSIQLTLPTEISLTGPLTVDNVTLSVPSGGTTIYANGHKLYIGSNVTSKTTASDQRLTVYGGADGGTVASTDITLLGGYYASVYGGGNGSKSVVNGNTSVVFGGNANQNDSTSDGNSNYVRSLLFGGARIGAVKGTTNVTVQDSAVIAVVSGAGATRGHSVQTKAANIAIKGGKVMNVYGGTAIDGEGFASSIDNGMTANIQMTGGTVESIFGGCESASMTGNANITLLGGEVTRRVVMGCYNDTSSWSLNSFKNEYHVTGTLTLNVGQAMQNKLCTGKGLSGTNDSDKSIYLGSRHSKNFDDEVRILNYLDWSGSVSSTKLKLSASKTNYNVESGWTSIF